MSMEICSLHVLFYVNKITDLQFVLKSDYTYCNERERARERASMR